jgi:hypothetical protein
MPLLKCSEADLGSPASASCEGSQLLLSRFHSAPLSVASPRSCYTSRPQHHAPAWCIDLAQPEPAAAASLQALPGPPQGRLPKRNGSNDFQFGTWTRRGRESYVRSWVAHPSSEFVTASQTQPSSRGMAIRSIGHPPCFSRTFLLYISYQKSFHQSSSLYLILLHHTPYIHSLLTVPGWTLRNL